MSRQVTRSELSNVDEDILTFQKTSVWICGMLLIVVDCSHCVDKLMAMQLAIGHIKKCGRVFIMQIEKHWH